MTSKPFPLPRSGRGQGGGRLALLLIVATGCYEHHRRAHESDARVECAPIPERASFHAEILAVSPEGCSVVGYTFDREVPLAEPLDPTCSGSIARSECAATLDFECAIPDLTTEYRGTVTRGTSVVTVVDVSWWTDVRCERTERWTWIE